MAKPYPYRRRRRYEPPAPQPVQLSLLTQVWQWVSQWWSRRQAGRWQDMDIAGSPASTGLGLGLGALLTALDWDNVREEVDRENRARIILIGAVGAGKSTLLSRLKGLDVSETSKVSGIQDYGLFAILDLDDEASGCPAEGDAAWFALQNADLILWMLDGAAGMRAWEYEWICRLRSMGKVLMIVLNKLDEMCSGDEVERVSQQLGCAILPISARDGTNVVTRLLPQIVDVCPNLTTALGRESPLWRRSAAQRVTRRAVWLSGLVGVEPVPLLDIPFQVLIQLRLVMRLAAIYGEPTGDRYSREMLATIVSGAALRYLGQQLAKVIPFVGWAASGALAAAGTWAIGQVAAEYFENGRRVPYPRLSLARLFERLRKRLWRGRPARARDGCAACPGGCALSAYVKEKRDGQNSR